MTKQSTDANEAKLKILQEWKKNYAESLIQALKPSGAVLQVGFGDGLTAAAIQKHSPKAHTIIESDPKKVESALKWAKTHAHVSVVPGTWEKVLGQLGIFDTVFFNESGEAEDMGTINFLFPQDAKNSSQEVQKILAALEEQMKKSKIKFKDADIDDFYQQMGKSNQKELPQFFQKLKENGNITPEQYAQAEKKFHLKEKSGKSTEKTLHAVDPLLHFIEACLKKHMHKGSRFSSFLNGQSSKYEDAAFMDKIITNPDVEYREVEIPVKMSDHPREGLAITVIKSV